MSGLFDMKVGGIVPAIVPQFAPDWAGKTVSVVATGPGATRAAVQACQGSPCVVVKESYRLAPWADALVAHDASWWAANPDAHGFEGARICGQEGPANVFVIPTRYERVRMTPYHELEILSTGIMAIRIVAAAAPAEIRLVGFDGGPGRWHSRKQRPAEAIEPATVALEHLIVELAAKGIKVTRA